MKKKAKCLLIGMAAAASVILLLLVSWYWDCLIYTEIFRAASPDGRHEVVVLKRTAFPPNELVDPTINVKVKLIGDSHAKAEETLLEDSDLNIQPNVVWLPGSVVVTDLSDRRPIRIELLRIE